jgi:hypothetical protein
MRLHPSGCDLFAVVNLYTMKTYLLWSLKATALLIVMLGLATLINLLISVVFMTTFADIQLSAIWILHCFTAIGLIIAAAHEEENK